MFCCDINDVDLINKLHYSIRKERLGDKWTIAVSSYNFLVNTMACHSYSSHSDVILMLALLAAVILPECGGIQVFYQQIVSVCSENELAIDWYSAHLNCSERQISTCTADLQDELNETTWSVIEQLRAEYDGYPLECRYGQYIRHT